MSSSNQENKKDIKANNVNTKKKKINSKPKRRGRRSKYETHVLPHLDRIPKWRRDGLIEDTIAKKLGVAMSTFSVYKLKYPELMESLKKGREHLIEELEDSLYRRAMGTVLKEVRTKYESGFQTEKIIIEKEVPGDTGAAIFALKNLAPTKWRNVDKIEVVNENAVKDDNAITNTLAMLKNRKVVFSEDEEMSDD